MDHLNLTMGIELEFAVVYEEKAFERLRNVSFNPGTAAIYPSQAITRLLQMAGSSSVDEVDVEYGNPYDRWTVGLDSMAYSKAEEASIPEGWQHEHVELASPIFTLANMQESAHEIQKVTQIIAVLRSTFHCAVITNQSSGFHVHLGNGKQFIPFPTAKRIAQLFTAHESHIDQMHSAFRILSPDIDLEPPSHPTALKARLNLSNEKFWCAPFSFFHQHASAASIQRIDSTTNNDANMFHWLARIEDRKSFSELGSLHQVTFANDNKNGHHASVNFDNSFQNDYTEDPSLKKTIEFRQHIGTVDATTIISWVMFLAQMCAYCHTACDEEFMSLLTSATDVRGVGLADFLKTLGCSETLVRHYMKMGGIGDAETLGVLGTDNTIVNPMVTALIDYNDAEQSFGYSQTEVQRRWDIKFFSGYYGLDPTHHALSLTPSDIRGMLEIAAVEHNAEVSRMGAAVARSAETLLFIRLGRVYAHLDNTCDARRRILQGVAAWKQELGLS